MTERMKKLCSKKYRIILQGVILCILIANAFYQGTRKEGYFGDELYSYHFVNQIEYPYITEDRGEEAWMNTWHDSDFFLDYLTITEEEAFDIAGTYQSISKDVHPPLFYLLLELICSAFSMVFPGVFSKWCAILINILFFTLTIVVLYKLAEYITESDFMAMAVCILYGLSVGAASTIVFIRMYMVLTFCCVIFTYLNALLWKRLLYRKNMSGVSLYLALFLSTILGILTHYYFFVYAFFISIVIWMYSLFAKKYRFLIEYALTMAAGILSAYLIWPDMLNDIFKGYRGTEAFDNFSGNTDWKAFGELFSLINSELFGGGGGLILLFLVLAALCSISALWWHVERHITEEGITHIVLERKEEKKKIEFQYNIHDRIVLQIIFAVLFYVFLISKIAPFREDRYIFNVYPMVILIVVYIVGKLLSHLLTGRLPIMIALLVLLCFTGIGYLTTGVNYLYRGTEEKLAVADSYSHLPAFYIHQGSTFRACGDSVYFSKARYTYPTREEELGGLKEALEELETMEGAEISQCLIYIDLRFSDTDSILEQVKQELNTDEIRLLFRTEYSAAYIME